MSFYEPDAELLGPYDRIDTNPENHGTYWGKDNGEGFTSWYDSSGNLDSSTPTPEYDDEYQRVLEDDERMHRRY